MGFDRLRRRARLLLGASVLACVTLLPSLAFAHSSAVPDGHGTVTALAAGNRHTCGLRSDGSAVCWGDKSQGQITAPVGATFTALVAGGSHSCGLRADGSAVCWGDNSYGQTTVPPAARFTALAAGYSHTCGLRADSSALCWGSNIAGQDGGTCGGGFYRVGGAQ